MISKTIELSMFSDLLGFNVNMNSFKSRLELQKMIYLLQVNGINLGYKYNWYLHGPYCSDLAKVGFEYEEEILISKNFRIEKDKWIGLIDEEVKLRIQNINRWIMDNKPDSMEKVDWIELLTSIHFIYTDDYYIFEPNLAKDKTISDLVRLKPKFRSKKEEALVAWDLLYNRQLLSLETIN